MWKCGNVKVTRFNIQFGISCWVLATMATFAYCDEVAMFTASVWRGETAYVEIPKTLQEKAAALSAQRAGNGVFLTLLRFDEVKYDLMS